MYISFGEGVLSFQNLCLILLQNDHAIKYVQIISFGEEGKKGDIYSLFRFHGSGDFFQKFCCQYTLTNSLLSPSGFHGYLGYYRSFIPLACSTWRLNGAVFQMRLN